MRDDSPSFRKTLRRWYSTVLGLTKSCAAASRLLAPRGDELGDAQLLRGEVVDRRRVALARALARGVELAAGALRPGSAPTPSKTSRAPIAAAPAPRLAPVAAQALAVGELRPGALVRRRLAGVQLEGLAEQRLGLVALGEDRATAGDHPVHGTRAG